MEQRRYLAIDLKSFYASVECVERGLDPLDTHLVVADSSRTEKTICLAVSPSLKAYGIPGRARLFEVVEAMRAVNARRRMNAPGHRLCGKSTFAKELQADPKLEADYIIAPPQMRKYMAYSARIYGIYLNYVAPEDIHIYSIDEVFMDVTNYLSALGLSARELAERIMAQILQQTGITATAGIGTNLYLAKVAMDIVAKHAAPNEHGARVGELNELSYRKTLWDHRPLTDFWRIGQGYARRLESRGVYTMGDIARMSLQQEDTLHRIFGIHAELLIDHAWGIEPCTLADIKGYVPENKSLCSGQVLMRPYAFEEGRLVAREMGESLSLDLADRGLVAGEISLAAVYDTENIEKGYTGEIVSDYYGRPAPKPVHGSRKFAQPTASTRDIAQAVEDIYMRIVDPHLTLRRFQVAATRLQDAAMGGGEQLSLFSDPVAEEEQRLLCEQERQRERREQKAVLDIRKKFGGNAIVKAMDLKEGATARDRREQVGGHKA
ncbi:MAG: DNA methylase [Clostridia bacterium]|nr:DNA methylase [Clostridia bacterium]